MGSVLDDLSIADSARVRAAVERAAFRAEGGGLREGSGAADEDLVLADGRIVQVTARVRVEFAP